MDANVWSPERYVRVRYKDSFFNITESDHLLLPVATIDPLDLLQVASKTIRFLWITLIRICNSVGYTSLTYATLRSYRGRVGSPSPICCSTELRKRGYRRNGKLPLRQVNVSVDKELLLLLLLLGLLRRSGRHEVTKKKERFSVRLVLLVDFRRRGLSADVRPKVQHPP